MYINIESTNQLNPNNSFLSKRNKCVTIVIAVCVTIAVVVFSSWYFSASIPPKEYIINYDTETDEFLVGGWTSYHKPFPEDKKIFDKLSLTEDWKSNDSQIVAVSTQVVDGINYRFIVYGFDKKTMKALPHPVEDKDCVLIEFYVTAMHNGEQKYQVTRSTSLDRCSSE